MVLLIHHLHVSASERVPWLCEELGVPYELKEYRRAPMLAPAEYKALHPQGTSPVIQDGELTLAETGAVMTYISHKYADGRLFLTPGNPAYADFLYWFHWVPGTFFPSLARVMAARASGQDPETLLVKVGIARFNNSLNCLNARLGDNEWLAGSEFTAADIMVVFPLTTMRFWFQQSWAEYPNIVAYLQRVGQREAYQRAMKKCDPDMEPALGAEPPKPFGQ